MATDLAKLVARLELQSGQFQSELTKANRKLAAFDTDVRKVGRRLSSGFKGLLAGLGVGATIGKIVSETSQAEAATAKLANAIERNAGAAGATVPEFAAMAARLQNLTTYSDEAVMEMQSLLLRFRQIGGNENRRAQSVILDLATALGTDLPAATKLVGRALADPVKGMTALSRAGVVLTTEQKALIKSLADTGRATEAQGVLLKGLEDRYGGAAEAARNTFGGAIAGLKNSFGELFELSGPSADKATEAINGLTKALQDPETKKAIGSLVSGFTSLFDVIVTGAAKAVNALASLPAAMDKGLSIEAKNAMLLYGTDDQAEVAMNSGSRGGGPRRGGRRNRAPAAVGEGAGEASIEVDKLTSSLQEFDVTAQRIQSDPLADFFDQLNDSTKTSAEQTVDEINKITAAVQALEREGIITAGQGQARIQERLDELLPAFDIQEIQKKRILVEAEVEKMNEFEIQAARETQSVIAESIRDAFTGSFDEIPKRFSDMIMDLIIQAQAAKLATYLFGDTASGGSTGGVLSSIASAFFGGGRAMGGAVTAGQAYMVGERRPEMFVPPTSGRIEPRPQGGSTVINLNVKAEGGEVSRPTRMALGATVARAMGVASRRNN